MTGLGLGDFFRRIRDRAVGASKQGRGRQRTTVQAPRFEVDPLWPKPINWLLGMAIGVWVDEQDHVWIIHRSSATLGNNEKGAELIRRSPSAAAARRRCSSSIRPATWSRRWGGPGPGLRVARVEPRHQRRLQGQRLDRRQRRQRRADPEVHEGRQVPDAVRQATARTPAATTLETSDTVAKIFVDEQTNEAYVATATATSASRCIDADTGKFKRYWGAYGNKPDDTNLGNYNPDAPPAQQFRNPVHCAELSNDGLVYVCDRANDRIQVFTPDGKFVKEAFVAKNTLATARSGTSRSRGIPQQTLHFHGGRPEQQGAHSPSISQPPRRSASRCRSRS